MGAKRLFISILKSLVSSPSLALPCREGITAQHHKFNHKKKHRTFYLFNAYKHLTQASPVRCQVSPAGRESPHNTTSSIIKKSIEHFTCSMLKTLSPKPALCAGKS